nr:hypothetical protein [Tanacetum cinerariifolium]
MKSGRVQLAPWSFQGIFMETILYHVFVLLVLNIGITFYAIPLSTSVSGGKEVKEVDIKLSGGRNKPHNVDAYEANCADIGYGFFPFSFSSFGELEEDAVALLKWIPRFSVARDIGARGVVYIFGRISFAIARVRA